MPPEDWGPEYPIPGTLRHNVPIPTLYSADGKLDVIKYTSNLLNWKSNSYYLNVFYPLSGQRLKPKLSIVELVLYNIAAMLAGVASGYDVRLSNVSPLHPRLQPNRYEFRSCMGPRTCSKNYRCHRSVSNTIWSGSAAAKAPGVWEQELLLLRCDLRNFIHFNKLV